MAVPTGSGTETLHSHIFKDIDSTSTDIIIGVQHHTYTILNVIVHCVATQAATNKFILKLLGYDAKAGVSATTSTIFSWTMVAGDTFVWNDKFSFFGAEGVASGSAMDATNQTVIAAQASTGPNVVQKLQVSSTNAADDCQITVSYIDQNWT